MKKFLTIYSMIVKINFSAIFAYRANFYNSVLITTGWGIISITSIMLLTARTSTVYGWTRQELFLLTGIYSIATGIFHMFFSASFERFSRTISLGELDGYLTKPLDTQFFLSTKTFRPISSIRVFIGILFTTYLLQVMHIMFNIFLFTFFTALILCGVLLMYSFWSLVITLTIWHPNLTNLVDFLYQINNLGRYPPSLLIYTKNLVVFLFIPLTLVASVPARVILGKVSAIEILGLISLSIGMFLLSRFFFQFALRSYTSASS